MDKQEAKMNLVGTEIAEVLNIVYNGIQYGAHDEPKGFVFTDPLTKSSFLAGDFCETEIRLSQLRLRFNPQSPEWFDGSAC